MIVTEFATGCYAFDNVLTAGQINQLHDYAEHSLYELNGVSGSRHPTDNILRQPKCVLSSSDIFAIDFMIRASHQCLASVFAGTHQAVIDRVYINAGFPGSPSLWHVDENLVGDWTIVVMGSSVWDRSWFGEFLVTNNGVVSGIEYKPGRILVFPAELEHRAVAASPLAGVTRYTYAIKLHVVSNIDAIDNGNLIKLQTFS